MFFLYILKNIRINSSILPYSYTTIISHQKKKIYNYNKNLLITILTYLTVSNKNTIIINTYFDSKK